MLSHINAVFSEHEINVVGQYLQTNRQIGYVVIDIHASERAESRMLKHALEQVPGTIRTRMLY